MRLLMCVICIAVIYVLSPASGLREREIVDGAAKGALAARQLQLSGQAGGDVAAAAGLAARLLAWLSPGRQPAPETRRAAPGDAPEPPAAANGR
ncbi:hypothetical protein ACFFJB_05310 [Camelimonas abortus]|uniref:Uncharacterized protein n=1 Tax=Camelimonas abortus TaxID=1017184 RepID=A0ABV7LBS1_9HYPH